MEELKKLIEKLNKDENITGVDTLLHLWIRDLIKYHNDLEYAKLSGAIYGLYGAGYISKREKDVIQAYLLKTLYEE